VTSSTPSLSRRTANVRRRSLRRSWRSSPGPRDFDKAVRGDTGKVEAGMQTHQDQQTANGQPAATGTIEEVQGVVVEVAFPAGELPEIYNALEVDLTDNEGDGESVRLVLEVQQHLGDDRIRAVAMDATDGLARGVAVRDTGGPITVPVGKGT